MQHESWDEDVAGAGGEALRGEGVPQRCPQAALQNASVWSTARARAAQLRGRPPADQELARRVGGSPERRRQQLRKQLSPHHDGLLASLCLRYNS